MSSGTNDKRAPSELTYPRFDHGGNLWVIVRPDGQCEFRTEAQEESIAADNAVYLKDAI